MRSRGFTLIEVMVVVVIIGVISSFFLLSIDVVGDDRDLEREARKLAALVELASDEAELQGRDFGLEFTRSGYRFVEYDPVYDTWTETVGDDTLMPRSLPEETEFQLSLEDRAIELAEQPADTGDGNDPERNSPLLKKYAPHVAILSSGDVSPFDVLIVRPFDDAEQRVSVEPNGNIVIGEVDGDAS